MAPLVELLVDRDLTLAVVGDGERHQRFEVHLALAVRLQQRRRDAAEADPLGDEGLGDAEAIGDLFHRASLLVQPAERLHLIGGVHGDAHRVLRKADLGDVGAVLDHGAGHAEIGRNVAGLGENVQRIEAPGAGDNLIDVVAGRRDHEVFQESVRVDRRHELRELPGARLGLPGVRRTVRELPEGDSCGCRRHCVPSFLAVATALI